MPLQPPRSRAGGLPGIAHAVGRSCQGIGGSPRMEDSGWSIRGVPRIRVPKGAIQRSSLVEITTRGAVGSRPGKAVSGLHPHQRDRLSARRGTRSRRPSARLVSTERRASLGDRTAPRLGGRTASVSAIGAQHWTGPRESQAKQMNSRKRQRHPLSRRGRPQRHGYRRHAHRRQPHLSGSGGWQDIDDA